MTEASRCDGDEPKGLALTLSGSSVINLSWISAIITFSLSFSLFLTLHFDELWVVYDVLQLPTLSLTGSYGAALQIFTAGLHLFSAFSMAFFIILYRVYFVKIETRGKIETDAEVGAEGVGVGCCAWLTSTSKCNLHKINKALLYVGLNFSLFMFLTGSLPLSQHLQLHGSAALLMFCSGCVHVVLFSASLGKVLQLQSLPSPLSMRLSGSSHSTNNNIINNNDNNNDNNSCNEEQQSITGTIHSDVNVADDGGRRTRSLHLMASFLVFPFNVGGLILAAAVFVGCDATECREFAVNFVVVLEYTTVLGLMLYLEGFRSLEFQKACLGYSQNSDRGNSEIDSSQVAVAEAQEENQV